MECSGRRWETWRGPELCGWGSASGLSFYINVRLGDAGKRRRSYGSERRGWRQRERKREAADPAASAVTAHNWEADFLFFIFFYFSRTGNMMEDDDKKSASTRGGDLLCKKKDAII